MALVATAFVALSMITKRGSHADDVSDVDPAIMIDLPPTASSSRPAEDAEDGPSQPPTPASAAPTPPRTVDPPKPVETLKTEKTDETPPNLPLPVQHEPAAVLDQHQAAKTPPATVAAPTSLPQEAHAPEASSTPIVSAKDPGDEGRPHASAHAITQWQRSLMRRLEIAKRAFGRQARVSGTVAIAFDIDGRGEIVSERIARSSGSPALDRAASALVRQAAPFPPPPPGASHSDESFVVPIVFRHE